MTSLLVALVFIANVSLAARIYVVNSLDESLGWADTETGESHPQAATLGNLANHLDVDGNRIFVVNSGLGTLQIIDRLTLQTIDEFAVNGAVNPYAAAVLDEQRVAVTGLLSGTLSVLYIDSGIADTVFVTGISPQAVHRFGDQIYVLNTGVDFPEYHQGTLKRYDLETYELVDSISVGINPQDMLVVDDEIHVLCTGNYLDTFGTVEIRGMETLELDTILHVGGSPGAFSSDGSTVYIAAGGWAGSGRIFRYDVGSRTILNDDSNPISCGTGASDIISLPDGGFAVSCFVSATVEHRTSSGELQREFLMSAGTGAIDMFELPSYSEPVEVVPNSRAIVKAYPNPFNSVLILEISGVNTASAVDIVDISGRSVASLPVESGQDRVFWNPSNASSYHVASGCYFARLRSPEQGRPVKLLYIK